MSTTTLFIELLIIGLGVCVWLVLLVSSLIGVNWLDRLINSGIKEYAGLVTAFVFAIAYMMGIVVDKFAKWIIEESGLCKWLRNWEDQLNRIWQKKNATNGNKFLKKYADIIVDKGDPMSDLLYGRSKVRILRASIINMPFITISGIIFLFVNSKGQLWWLIAIVGSAFTLLIIYLYFYNDWLYQRRLQSFHNALKEANEKVKKS